MVGGRERVGEDGVRVGVGEEVREEGREGRVEGRFGVIEVVDVDVDVESDEVVEVVKPDSVNFYSTFLPFYLTQTYHDHGHGH